MVVSKPGEDSFNHLVDKEVRTLDAGDLCAESLTNSEVTTFETNEIPEAECALQLARRHEAFLRKRGAFDMCSDVEREIETAILRRIDDRADDDLGHDSNVSRYGIAAAIREAISA